ncbi:hypothetical protein [Leptospira interrogans]|uniref:hypothetical protein n=1 Tax=Leptospira interrogans TaxID=173 RepID=UPI0002C00671|nr:hypothetical protein [Leptospira interrogans]EMO94244.1 hypothetical protein LEP1GSC109_3140 [Leptospira interrogans str. UI 13372]
MNFKNSFSMSIQNIFYILKNRRNTIYPLRFSEEAVTTIRTHLLDRFETAFQVKLERKHEHTKVQVGYDRKKGIKTIHTYPVELEIAKEDEICLEGSMIDWDSEKHEFKIYPDVDVEIEYNGILNHFEMQVNRNVFSNDKVRVYTKTTGFPSWFPVRENILEINKVKIKGRIWKLTLEDWCQPEEIMKIESSIANEVLDYFSDFPKRQS